MKTSLLTQRVTTRSLLSTAMTLCLSLPAFASPQQTGATAGVVFDNPTAGVTNITAPDNAIIDYSSFNVGAGETVNFIQPSATARVLNRINGNTPSQIDGNLNANGILYFVNPAGVTFGPNSVVNAAGIFAAAGSMADADFLGNNDFFTGVTGDITNHGIIRADTIAALVGDTVTNNGTISVPNGTVVLASGNEAYIGSARGGLMVQVDVGPNSATGGINQNGTIDAQSVSLVTGDLASLAMTFGGSGMPTPPSSVSDVDTDGDGDVDFDDINTAIANRTGSLPFGTGGKTQADGDTDKDGDVDNIDISNLLLFFTGPITPGPAADPNAAGPFSLVTVDPLEGLPVLTQEILLSEVGLNALFTQIGITPRPLIASERLTKAQARALYNDLVDAAPVSTQPQGVGVASVRLEPDVVRQALVVYRDRIAAEGIPADQRIAEIRTATEAAYQAYVANNGGFDAQGFAQFVQANSPALADRLAALDELRSLTRIMGLNEVEQARSDQRIVTSAKPEGMSEAQMAIVLDTLGQSPVAADAG